MIKIDSWLNGDGRLARREIQQMKVKVEFVLDVNREDYEAEYGSNGAAEIREEVRGDALNGITGKFDNLGIGYKIVRVAD